MKSWIITALFGLFAVSAQAQELSLKRLNAYIGEIDTLQAEFTQINSDGTIDTGQLLIDRPGKMRFDYNAPNGAMVLASAGSVAVFDSKSNVEPSYYPLKKTPLSLILSREISLEDSKFVQETRYSEGVTRVLVAHPKHPESGAMWLSFTSNPVALRGWVMMSEDGQETTIVFRDLKEGPTFKNTEFSVHKEISRRSQ